jgi:hypothetical protein
MTNTSFTGGSGLADTVSALESCLFVYDGSDWQRAMVSSATPTPVSTGASGLVQLSDGSGGFSSDSKLYWTSGSSTFTVNGKLTVTGLIDPTGLVIDEKANIGATGHTTVAGKGLLWVKSDTPNSLMFTDDAGTDVTVVSGGAMSAGAGFVLEDGDGTEVTIVDGKEVKFVEGTGIDIDWTDTSPGSDADPYDLTFTVDLEGTELKSTGEGGGSKFLREDGDGTCSWQTVSGGGASALNDLSDVSYSSGDLTITSLDTVTFANGGAAVVTVANTAANTAGKDLTISAGSEPGGASNNADGGDLILASGGGDGTGTSAMTFSTKVSGTDAVAERMRIHTDGNVGIGTSAPAVDLEILDITGSSATQGGSLRLSANDSAAMASGHRLGVLEFAGAEDGSDNMIVGGRIEVLTEGLWSPSENGASLLFYTTDGNASQSEALRLDSDNVATFAGDIIMSDGKNINLNTSNGTKIGTATSQKLGFYDVTPVIQPTSAAGSVTTSGFIPNSGAGFGGFAPDSTHTGGTGSNAYTIGDIVHKLKELGLIAV